jgi:hypothetical protein
VSAFAACAPYYGQGGAIVASAPAYSIELECPYKSGILTGNTPYSLSDGRVGRMFALGSGDPCAAVGSAFLPGFHLKNYQSCIPIQYCFLDLDELVIWLQAWFLQLAQKLIDSQVTGSTLLAVTPFSCTAQQFRIVVRQVVLGLFATSQSMSQFMTYSTNPQGFEPFRVGSNTYAANRYEMTMPELLVENIRMLLPHFYSYKTAKYNREKNKMMYVPVWGIYKSIVNEAPNLEGNLWDVLTQTVITQPLFSAPVTTDPNPIDGTDQIGNVCLLNCGVTTNIIGEWNFRITELKQFSLPSTYLAGTSQASLLPYTRYANYIQVEVELDKIPWYMRHKIPRCSIKQRSKEMKRVNSKTLQVTETKEMYIPDGATLFSQQTLGFSSIFPITEALRELTNYLIFPTIIIESSDPPTQKQVRTANMQPHIFDFQDLGRDLNNPGFFFRGNKLFEVGQLCAPGTAAQASDELANVVKKFADESKGGFVGDILGGLAQSFASSLPF